MTKSSKPEQQPPRLGNRMGGLIVAVTVLTIVGLTIADFANDGKVDVHWIGALLIIALTFGGYGMDKLFSKWFGP